MKNVVLASTLILFASAGLALADQEIAVSTDASEKLRELESMPVGIAVSHTPSLVRYTLNPSNVSGVEWQFSTTVSAMAGPVTIVEFGYFVERNEQWELNYENELPLFFSSNDFASEFDCPNALMMPGKSYTNPENQSAIDCVPEQLVKWYFIGIDAEGNRAKGEAGIKLITELDPSEHGPKL
ncbi:MAG: hypothetical protein ACI9HY_000728 [Planctomycetaceae bacterium]|jgi:hypothetical protein